MKKQYINVTLSVFEEHFDLTYGLLSHLEYTGIEEKFDQLIITFDEKNWNEETKSIILSILNNVPGKTSIVSIDTIQEQNWNEEWEKTVQPIHVNDRIGIAPQWHADKLTEDLQLIINPKMSFGTGDHSTTRLVCRLMEDLVQKDSFWIDAGTGTGVLAILAIKLGAQAVYAFDNDHWSTDNTLENIKLNDIPADSISVEEADIYNMTLPTCDGIAANMNILIIEAAIGLFYQSLKDSKGTLICSGILVYHKDDVLEFAKKAGFKLIKVMTEGDWIAFHFEAK